MATVETAPATRRPVAPNEDRLKRPSQNDSTRPMTTVGMRNDPVKPTGIPDDRIEQHRRQQETRGPGKVHGRS